MTRGAGQLNECYKLTYIVIARFNSISSLVLFKKEIAIQLEKMLHRTFYDKLMYMYMYMYHSIEIYAKSKLVKLNTNLDIIIKCLIFKKMIRRRPLESLSLNMLIHSCFFGIQIKLLP